jgi:hypothetical protein
MELTQQQSEQLTGRLPQQRENVKGDTRTVRAAILSVVEPGGKWHTLYTRLNRWAQSGVLDRVLPALLQQLIRVRVEVGSLASPVVKVHPDGMGARKKWATSPRQVPRGLADQASSGCRGCSPRYEVFVVCGLSRRCA